MLCRCEQQTPSYSSRDSSRWSSHSLMHMLCKKQISSSFLSAVHGHSHTTPNSERPFRSGWSRSMDQDPDQLSVDPRLFFGLLTVVSCLGSFELEAQESVLRSVSFGCSVLLFLVLLSSFLSLMPELGRLLPSLPLLLTSSFGLRTEAILPLS